MGSLRRYSTTAATTDSEIAASLARQDHVVYKALTFGLACIPCFLLGCQPKLLSIGLSRLLQKFSTLGRIRHPSTWIIKVTRTKLLVGYIEVCFQDFRGCVGCPHRGSSGGLNHPGFAGGSIS